MIWADIYSPIKATHGCKKYFPSYQFNSLKFDSKNLFVTTPWDHLNNGFPNCSNHEKCGISQKCSDKTLGHLRDILTRNHTPDKLTEEILNTQC